MWGSIGGLFQAPAPPDRLPEELRRKPAGVFSLGEDEPPPSFAIKSDDPPPVFPGGPSVARTASGAPASSASGSNLPQALQAPKVAAQVRNLSRERIDAAWSRLQSEFGVQKLVWESLKLTRGKEFENSISTLLSVLQESLDAQQKDMSRAVRLLAEAIAMGDKEDGDMSKSMLEACRNVQKQTTTPASEHRKELAERLEVSGTAATLPKTEADKKELEGLVTKCELEDTKLERSVRRLLLLRIPPELGEAVSSSKRSSSLGSNVKATGSRLGAAVSSKKSSSRTRSVGAPVDAKGVSSQVSNLLRRLPPPSGDVGKPTDVVNLDDVAPGQKGVKLAETVRSLAVNKNANAWRELKGEFDTQKMVWESLAMHKKVDTAKVSTLQTTIEGAIAARTKNSTIALRTMEKVLKDEAGSDVLSNAMVQAIRNVIEQAALVLDRSKLAERLAVAGVAATLPREQAGKRELEALVVSCKLGDASLERAVREAFFLPMSAELGATATTTPKKSGMAAVGAKVNSALGSALSKTKKNSRASSTSGIKANPQNKPIQQRIRENQIELPFDPPKRAMIEL